MCHLTWVANAHLDTACVVATGDSSSLRGRPFLARFGTVCTARWMFVVHVGYAYWYEGTSAPLAVHFLHDCTRTCSPVALACPFSQMTYVEFLVDLLDEEIAQRRTRNIQTKMRMAHLPYQKTLTEFDFAFQPCVDKKLIDELKTMNFVRQASNVIFLGPPGVGKSHISVALAMEALAQSISVYFTSVTQLV